MGWTQSFLASSVFGLLVLTGSIGGHTHGGVLTPDYYKQSCPHVEEIIRRQVEIAVHRDPRLAAAFLRLHFHDCFVLGCDASILLDNGPGIASEKEAGPNINSLRGFEVVDEIKYLVEEACPAAVSCSDILAIAARDAVHMRGGPYWEVELGRRDSLKASQSAAVQYLPTPNFTLEMLISNFAVQGLSPADLVALSGGHTIGRSRCLSFKERLYTDNNYNEKEYDYHRRYTQFHKTLRSICPRSSKRDNARVPLDFMTSSRFDNNYFHNLLEGKGLLESDNVLVTQGHGSEISELVWSFAANQKLFFREFAASMVKMGRINPLTGADGEIRRNCRVPNLW